MSLSNVLKVAGAVVATAAFASTASAGCGGATYCNTNTSTAYHTPAPKVVPFTTSVSNVSSMSIAGLGPNERLCPTKCPVNVYNPEGGKVLGCYNVCKPVQPVQHTYVQQWVRVVRPVIYVRYPVPTPVPVAVPTCYAPVMPMAPVRWGGC